MTVFGWLSQPGWRRRLVIGGGVFLVALVAFGVFEWLTAAHLGTATPETGSYLARRPVEVAVATTRIPAGSDDVRMSIDGKPVPAGQIQVTGTEVRTQQALGEGPHVARVQAKARNVFSRSLDKTWSFTVDTMSPRVDVVSPASLTTISKPGTPFKVNLSEDASATLEVNGRKLPLTHGFGTAERILELEQGSQRMRLSVVDKAGNVTTKQWTAYADYTGPQVTLTSWPKGTVKDKNGYVGFTVADNLPQGVAVIVRLDGNPVTVAERNVRTIAAKKTAGAKTKKESTATPVSNTSATATATATAKPASSYARDYKAPYTELPEGTHTYEVVVVDKGGHKVVEKTSFTVDSTDFFGFRPIGRGAKGGDVSQLQRILATKGLYKGKVDGAYSQGTADAVAKYRVAHGLSKASYVDMATLRSILGAIKIDRSARRLYLIRDGKVVKSYGVAVGMPQYPTPTGSYHIVVKEVNPTWNPPPSPWASGLEPVPPGPGNPLGTRWMGLSAPAVGIHGTYNDGSIGRAASHGCIRMHIPDNEELFNLVYVGTPVTIVN